MKHLKLLCLTFLLSAVSANVNPQEVGVGAVLEEVSAKSQLISNEENDEVYLSGNETPFEAFYMSLSMIFVSEIGDKTFLLAALMAMRHPRMVIFSASGSALVLMTFLSGILGYFLPALLSPKVTKLAASVLFLFFGLSLLKEGWFMSKDQGIEDEMQEVKEEVAAHEIKEKAGDLEEGTKKEGNSVMTLANYILTPVWIQTFVMTFLGEWGDRSQIATIAMAAGSDYSMVVFGGSIGHLFCSFVAVSGGQMLASKISMKTVILVGSVAFLSFSGLYFHSFLYDY